MRKAADTTLLSRSQAVIGGFLWLGNNLHNIKGDPDRFRMLFEAAVEDARPLYDELERIREKARP